MSRDLGKVSHVDVYLGEEHFRQREWQCRGNAKCKGPEVAKSLRNSKEGSAGRTE